MDISEDEAAEDEEEVHAQVVVADPGHVLRQIEGVERVDVHVEEHHADGGRRAQRRERIEAVPIGQTIERLAGGILLTDLTLELDRVDTVPAHGPYSSKARHPWSIRKPHLSGPRGALQSGVLFSCRLTDTGLTPRSRHATVLSGRRAWTTRIPF
jgi:hypothetical protein